MPHSPPPPNLAPPPLDDSLRTLIRLAVREDLAPPGSPTLVGDKTVQLTIPPNVTGSATIVARRPGVISGTFLIPAILEHYPPPPGQPPVSCTIHRPDGDAVSANDRIATLAGPLAVILSAERVILNFLAHLSGIATLTRRYVDAIAAEFPDHPGPALCDIRKTTPGFRTLDKFAVRCGGGVNHRMGLYDGVMLKDNHLAALKKSLGKDLPLRELLASVRARLDPAITLWLEVDTLEQLAAALPDPAADPSTPAAPPSGADIILLDNFSPEQMRQAVQMRDAAQSKIKNQKSKILLEASGGITLENLREIARTGVERISIGAITHSAPALDLSMEFAP